MDRAKLLHRHGADVGRDVKPDKVMPSVASLRTHVACHPILEPPGEEIRDGGLRRVDIVAAIGASFKTDTPLKAGRCGQRQVTTTHQQPSVRTSGRQASRPGLSPMP